MIVRPIIILIAVALLSGIPSARADDAPTARRAGGWSDALPYYNRGNRYLSQGRYSDAVKDYQQAIEYYPEDPDFYINMGVALRKLESYTEAEQCFREAAKFSPKDWVVWSNLANACLKQNRLKETIANFKKAIQCGPPAKERAAMEQDIADINKILKMQTPPPVAQTSAGSEKSKGSTLPANGNQVTNKPPLASGQAKAPSQPTKPQDAGLRKAVVTEAPASDGKSLQDSGWDYTQH